MTRYYSVSYPGRADCGGGPPEIVKPDTGNYTSNLDVENISLEGPEKVNLLLKMTECKDGKCPFSPDWTGVLSCVKVEVDTIDCALGSGRFKMKRLF